MKEQDQGIALYEAATIMSAKPDGTFNIHMPEIPQIVVPFFQKRKR